MSSNAPQGAVFLGGACGTSTWRQQIAIPLLEAAGVSFHNPQIGVGEWTEAHEAGDIRAKNAAAVLLFVITEATRGVASIAEASYLIASGHPLALCLRMLPGTDQESVDLNRGRLFLRTMTRAHGVPVFDSEASATQYAIELVERRFGVMTEPRLRSLLAGISCGELSYNVDGLRLRVAGASGWTGRWWLVNEGDSESDVIRTAFKAAITWEEHELRERFRYQGVAIFGPHVDVERLRRGA